MLENRVVQFACGILYSHSFKLLDNWGAIADSILYNNKFFSAKYFPQISTQYTTSRSLSNDACGHSLQLTSNNLIYTHVVQDDFTICFFKSSTNSSMPPFTTPLVFHAL